MSLIIKCKMCGGDIEVTDQKSTVGKCRYCGSTMTLPRIESEKKARLFNRANEYRMHNDFDKAYDAYKTITEEDEQEAEAYWGMILSEYGVEYVEDPKSGMRMPTCHRTQMQSIQASVNFHLALQYADSERKLMYQDEAETLDKLQRSILAVSSKEEPYDVFICYKETDDFTGERTQDSVLAQEIYKELEKANIRPFFARISLESHLGENYEPFIYAALKSARVMLVVTTSGEHCEAVWVKNEWARFLHFMSEDDGKALIPVYRDMSPYELPTELSGFQAQDMGKVGAVQDLVHGVQKILGTTQTESRNAKLDALVADKHEREAKERKLKRNIKIGVIVAIVIALFLFGGLLRSKYAKEYSKKYNIYVQYGPTSGGHMKQDLLKSDSFVECYFRTEYHFDNGMSIEDAVKGVDELYNKDPQKNGKSSEGAINLCYSWVNTSWLKTLADPDVNGGKKFDSIQFEHLEEGQFLLTEEAVKIINSSDYIKSAHHVSKDYNYVLQGAIMLAERGVGDAYVDAARMLKIFAAYEPEAEEALKKLLAEHPDALDKQ